MNFWMNFVRIEVIAITIYPSTMAFGVTGTALSGTCGILATIPVWGYVSAGIIKSNYRKLK